MTAEGLQLKSTDGRRRLVREPVEEPSQTCRPVIKEAIGYSQQDSCWTQLFVLRSPYISLERAS